MKATLDYCSLEMRNITPLENVRNTNIYISEKNINPTTFFICTKDNSQISLLSLI